MANGGDSWFKINAGWLVSVISTVFLIGMAYASLATKAELETCKVDNQQLAIRLARIEEKLDGMKSKLDDMRAEQLAQKRGGELGLGR